MDPKFHPKIIGRRGAVVTKIRQDHDVHILFPDKTSERPDLIVITGLQEKAEAAREDILRLVQDLVSRSVVKKWYLCSILEISFHPAVMKA